MLIIEVNITNIERWISLFKETRVGNENAKIKITLAYIYYEKLDIINSLDFDFTLVCYITILAATSKMSSYIRGIVMVITSPPLRIRSSG